jgi:homoserine kinase
VRGRGRERGGAIFDAIFFIAVSGLTTALIALTTVIPNARKASRVEREALAAEVEVAGVAAEVERLRLEVAALQSDPWFIERTLRRRLRELRPDLFPPQVLPAPASATAATER